MVRHRYLYIFRFFPVLVALVVVGCTFTEPRIRAEPVIFRPVTSTPGASTSSGLVEHCAEWHPCIVRAYDWMQGVDGGECIYDTFTYQSVVDELGKPDAVQPTVYQILDTSDYNCINFLNRAFALRVNGSFFKDLVSTGISSTAAVVSLVGPAVITSGLSAGNAVIGGGFSAFLSNYFANKGMIDLITDIINSRHRIRERIQPRLDAPRSARSPAASAGLVGAIPSSRPSPTPAVPYAGVEALKDIQDYDQTCSLMGVGTPVPTATATPTPHS